MRLCRNIISTLMKGVIILSAFQLAVIVSISRFSFSVKKKIDHRCGGGGAGTRDHAVAPSSRAIQPDKEPRGGVLLDEGH